MSHALHLSFHVRRVCVCLLRFFPFKSKQIRMANRSGETKTRYTEAKQMAENCFDYTVQTNKKKSPKRNRVDTAIANLLLQLLFLLAKIQLGFISPRTSSADLHPSLHRIQLISGERDQGEERMCVRITEDEDQNIQRNRQHEFAACCVQINGSNVLNFRVFTLFEWQHCIVRALPWEW